MQVLLWRPAELLNGRLAMIGFTAAIANEAITGASLWQQLYFAPLCVPVSLLASRCSCTAQQGIWLSKQRYLVCVCPLPARMFVEKDIILSEDTHCGHS